MLGNLRRHTQYRYSGSAWISWDDRNGYRKFAKAEIGDISESGLGLLGPEPIPTGTYIFIDAVKLGIRANASVRHCERRAVTYAIGVEFAGGPRLKDVPGSFTKQ